MFCAFFLQYTPEVNQPKNHPFESTDYVQVSMDFLEALKNQKDITSYLEILSNSTTESLESNLNTNDKRLAFWINIYNAFIQVYLTENPQYYEDRRQFFKLPLIEIAGRKMSFADIEHGIIRRSQMELFLGYISNPFAPKYERKLRVFQRDYRIHFALNCGAKSCPPIAIFSAENLNTELDFIASKFLSTFSEFSKEENLVSTTALFSWFRGDFGGSDGIREILYKYKIVPSKEIRVKTSPYDWTLLLNNYVNNI